MESERVFTNQICSGGSILILKLRKRCKTTVERNSIKIKSPAHVEILSVKVPIMPILLSTLYFRIIIITAALMCKWHFNGVDG